MKRIVCVMISLLLAFSGMVGEAYAETVSFNEGQSVMENITPKPEKRLAQTAAEQLETAGVEEDIAIETADSESKTEPEESEKEEEESARQEGSAETEESMEQPEESVRQEESEEQPEKSVRQGKSTEPEESMEQPGESTGQEGEQTRQEKSTESEVKAVTGELSDSKDQTETARPKEETIRVLMVGNSFTRHTSNGVTYLVKRPLEELAEGEGHSLEVTALAHSAARLRYYAGMNENYYSYHKELLTLLVNEEWDYIIFQEQSTAPIEYFDTSTYPAVETLLQMVKKFQPQATPLLYMIQGYSDGTAVKVGGVSRVLRAEEMQVYLGAAYTALENKLGVEVVPVGIHAIRASRLYPQIQMWGSDAKHPAYAGYYLAACAFYQRIYGSVPDSSKADLMNCNLTGQELLSLAALTADSIKLNKKEIALAVNKTAKLTASVSSQTAGASGVTYRSLDPGVATVNEMTGTVKAVAGGTTSIVAESADGLQAFCSVTVKIPLSFGRSCYLAGIGDKLRILPQTNAKNLKWSSNKKRVASVTKGTVTAKAAGKAVITVTNREDPKDKASYILYVACAAPTGLKAASAGSPAEGAASGKIKISWKAAAGAAKYEIYRSTSKNGPYKRIGTSRTTSYTDKNAAVDKCYYYKVKARNKYKYCTSPLSGSTRGIVLKATTLKADRTAGKYAKLTWRKNPKASGYVIYRSAKKNSGYKKIAAVGTGAVTSYIDKTVNEKNTYYYRIKAYKEMNGKVFYGVKSRKAKI